MMKIGQKDRENLKDLYKEVAVEETVCTRAKRLGGKVQASSIPPCASTFLDPSTIGLLCSFVYARRLFGQQNGSHNLKDCVELPAGYGGCGAAAEK